MKKILCVCLSVLLLGTMIPSVYAASYRTPSTPRITYIDGTHPLNATAAPRGSSYYKVIAGVPTSLDANETHYCIPCAITNIAGYYSTHDYPLFGCSDTAQEAKAVQVQNAMCADGGSYTSNAYINQGFDCLSYTSGTTRYSLQATPYWSGSFSFTQITNEIFDNHPFMLGFAAVPGTPYKDENDNPVAHMTVCVGFQMDGNTYYLYVSDAHSDYYRLIPYRPDTYNDFIATVRIVTSPVS